MLSQKMTPLKSSDKWEKFAVEGGYLIYRNAGTITGDKDTNPYEKIYLTSGSARITIIKQKQ